MTINYTTLLGLAKPVTGTETGQWGDVVNDQITSLLEDAVANASTISVTAGNVTLSTTTGASNQARMSTLILTGTPGTTRNVVAPSQSKMYVVINQSDGAVVIKGSATTGVTVGAGQTAQVAWNGSDFVEIGNYVHGNFVVNGNLSVNGNSTLGDGGADTTTINGQFVGANANISKATTLSTSAPAFFWLEGATYTDTGTAGGTTQPHATFHQIDAPTVNTSNIVTYTNASTLYIAGAPSAAGSATITNPYALFINGGASYFGAAVTMAATTQNLALGTSQTSGTWTAGGAAQTGTITLDQSTKAHTLNIGTGATENATTKAINLGTAGVSGSTTNLTYGSGVAGSTTTHIWNSGGTEGMRLNSTGLGLSTTPATKLHLSAASPTRGIAQIIGASGNLGAQLQFTQSSVADWTIGQPANTNSFAFWSSRNTGNDGVQEMTVTTTGLGIGTDTPTQKLDVNISNPTRGIIACVRNGASATQTGAQLLFTQNAIEDWTIGQPAAETNAFVFWKSRNSSADGNEIFRIADGTSTLWSSGVNAQLTINGATRAAINLKGRFTGSSTDIGSVNFVNNADLAVANIYALSTTGSATDGGQMVFRTTTTGGVLTEAMRIGSNQRVSIGSNQFAGQLYVYSGSLNEVLRLEGSSTPFMSLYIGSSRRFYIEAASSVNLYTEGAYPLAFGVNGSYRAQIDTSGNVLIGTSTVRTKLTVDGDTTRGYFSFKAGSDAQGYGGFQNSAGTNMGYIGGGNGGAISAGASTDLVIRGEYNLIFAYGNTEQGRFDTARNFLVGSTAVPSNFGSLNGTVTAKLLQPNGSSTPGNMNAAVAFGGSTGSPNAGRVFFGDNTGWEWEWGYVDSSLTYGRRFYFTDGGAAYNSTGTWGTISSSLALKQDITDATSQWNDIKSIQFHKFRYIADVAENPDTPMQMGVIAEELEAVCPNLVARSKSGAASIKYSILYMKAVKALQEAMAKIEQLEARVSTLEA